MVKVGPHKRRTRYGTVTVRPHARRLQPRRAGRNAKRAWKAARRRQRSNAAIFAAVAVAEIGTWTFLRGSSAALVGAGIALAALGYAAKRRT